MRKKSMILLILVFSLLIGSYNTLFFVEQRIQAIVLQFGEPIKVNIGVASWIPLERSLALFDKTLKDKINIVGQDYENADYIFSNNITEVNSTINKKYQIPKNFKKIGEFVIEKTLIYEVYKKEI